MSALPGAVELLEASCLIGKVAKLLENTQAALKGDVSKTQQRRLAKELSTATQALEVPPPKPHLAPRTLHPLTSHVFCTRHASGDH